MNEHIAHSRAWGTAAIVIVVASWIFYRYFAPKTGRELYRALSRAGWQQQVCTPW